MHRFVIVIAAAGLLGGAAGCCHTAGRCDCEPCNHPSHCHYYSFGYGSGCGAGNGAVAPAAHAEPIKEAPRPLDGGAVPPKKEVSLPAEQGTLPTSLDNASQPSK